MSQIRLFFLNTCPLAHFWLVFANVKGILKLKGTGDKGQNRLEKKLEKDFFLLKRWINYHISSFQCHAGLLQTQDPTTDHMQLAVQIHVHYV